MFRNILVGIDGSASAALAVAIEIARASGGRLGVLSVAASPTRWIALPPFAVPVSRPQLAAQLRADAQRRLDRAERTVPADVPVTKLFSQARATVPDALLEYARHGPWDLIVVGHRRAAAHWPLRRAAGPRSLRAGSVPVLIVT